MFNVPLYPLVFIRFPCTISFPPAISIVSLCVRLPLTVRVAPPRLTACNMVSPLVSKSTPPRFNIPPVCVVLPRTINFPPFMFTVPFNVAFPFTVSVFPFKSSTPLYWLKLPVIVMSFCIVQLLYSPRSYCHTSSTAVPTRQMYFVFTSVLVVGMNCLCISI